MRITSITLLLSFLAVGCSPGGEPVSDAPKGPPRPDVVDDAVLDERIDDILRERLTAATAGLADVLDLRVTDDTPRIDVPEEDPRGAGYAFLPGASLYLPAESADALSLTIDERGLTVRLVIGSDELIVRDGTGSAAGAQELERLRALGRDPWDGAWGEIESEVARWAGDASSPAAVKARIDAARARVPKWAEPFEKGVRSMSRLRREALRATAGDPENRGLHPLYRTHRLGLLKQSLVEATGSAGTVQPFAAGPTEGFRSGESGKDATVVFSVGGPDDMLVDVVARSLDGSSPVAIPAETLVRVGGSCRPYARSAAEAAAFPAGTTPVARALSALSCFQLDPNADRAAVFVDALVAIEPRQPKDELTAVVRWLCDRIAADAATRDRLLRAIAGG